MIKKEQIKRINEWMMWDERRPGCTSLNVKYLREFNDLDKEYAKMIMSLYFLVANLNLNNMSTMFVSAQKQRKLIYATRQALKEYQVSPYFDKMFKNEVVSLRRRISHVNLIIRENIHLTEYEPFFKQVGWDAIHVDELPTFEEIQAQKDSGSKTNALSPLGEMAREWNAEHPDIVAAHMAAIKPEIEAYERHKAAIAIKEKAEKEARKAARKAENDEVKEIKKNKHRDDVRRHVIDRSMEYLYK